MKANLKIGFWGAGKMAEGILSAMAAVKSFDPSQIVMAEKNEERAREMSKKYKVFVTDDVIEVAKKSAVVFLAVKPQDVDALAKAAKPFLNEKKLLISIAAGKTLNNLKRVFGAKVRIIRVMPNLALMAKEGMCAICASKNVKPSDLKLTHEILGAAGKTIELPEKHFDAVTALSGSGPAFYAYMQQAMFEAGISLGLPRAAAELLAGQTVLGTSVYLQNTKTDLDKFISAVCSKGGTTAAGMDVLRKSDFKNIIKVTLAAARDRSKEL